jgi:CSLREA domain-containing protein
MSTISSGRFGATLLILFVAYSFEAANASTITVTTALDVDLNDGLCSLREAIIASNTNVSYNGCVSSAPSVGDTIAFNIPGTGAQTIAPLSPLPVITEAVMIDGWTQPGSVNFTGLDHPLFLIVLDGTAAGQAPAVFTSHPAQVRSAAS